MTTDLNELLRDVVIPDWGTAEHLEYMRSVIEGVRRDSGSIVNLAKSPKGRSRFIWERTCLPAWNWGNENYAIIPSPPPPVIVPYRPEQLPLFLGRMYRDKRNGVLSLFAIVMDTPDMAFDGCEPEEAAIHFEWVTITEDPATGNAIVTATGPCGNERAAS